ncbi:[protein-PII] uridylyltransferase [Aliikangiella sp. IMCC44359]|uniref:[protein-PII] uridylyltransferase n=1 Tax=Aliikangiella sp. IMCC44359 TaxID=3459125 RepID=UPI00403B33F0
MDSNPKAIQVIRQQINVFNEQLELNFRTTPIESLLENRASFIDGVLIELWELSNCPEKSLSLNAVGGYGRKTLHPHSDIDICILYDGTLTKNDEDNLQVFITKVWDLGLKLGHSVRSLIENEQECKKDITAATNLLDIRYICGNSNHEMQVKQAIYSNRLWTRERFFNAKLDEQKKRHKKQNNQSFKLEPNLKDGPGGLRDIQTLFWVSKKSLASSNLKLLRQKGHLHADEYAELIEAQNFIWRVRWALHKVTGRDENRMLLEYQAEIASLLGFGDSNNFAIEKMMRQLFRASKRIREINQMVLSFLKHDVCSSGAIKIETINQNFELQNGMLNVRSEDVFVYRKEILVMFRIIAHSTQHEIKEISPETIRLMRQARRRLLGDLQDFEECRSEFINILNGSGQLKNALALMHHHGILSAYLPQWREVVGQMQFDMFHAYTVDEHTFQTISNVIELTSNKNSEKHSELQPLFSKIKQRSALLIAALFHDIAKGRGGDHSELGMVDAQQFCLFHNVKQTDTNLITWLVENHLLMSITSQRQDIHDPEVIRNFAKLVGTQSKLDALYCLTVADINATNDNLWTSWKASLMEKLYLSTKMALREGVENVFTVREKVKERKREALFELAEMDLSTESVLQLWKQFTIPFFSNFQTEEIIYFTQKLLTNAKYQSFISLSEEAIDGCTCIFAYMPDRDGIFSALFSTLSTLKVEVKDAQITKTRDGFVLEIIKVLDFNHELICSAIRRQEIEQRLLDVLIHKKMEPTLPIPKYLHTFENKIDIEYLSTRKKHRTLISITALDNPSFMERICQCFHDLNIKIHSAKISTIGEMVDNVFLVSDKNDDELSHKDKIKLEARLQCQVVPDLVEP